MSDGKDFVELLMDYGSSDFAVDKVKLSIVQFTCILEILLYIAAITLYVCQSVLPLHFSASFGRNALIFSILLLHDDLYSVSPLHAPCSSTSCLLINLVIF